MTHDPSAHPHRRRPGGATMLLALAVLLVATGCGGGTDDTTESAPTADPAAAAATTDEPATGEPAADEPATEDATTGGGAEAADGDAVVGVASTDLGEVLVDAEGLTLYGFTNDTGGTSSCTGDCASTWPPVIVEEGFAVGEGLDAGLFTTTERDDGSLQLVAGDWPLYLYAADAAPGDTNGQGVGDVWFVVDPAGQLVQDDATSSAAGPGNDY